MTDKKDVVICGFVSPGWEDVRTEFLKNFTERKEVGASCCVFVHGRCVVDLWGGIALKKTGRLWKYDTLANVYSCSKGITNITLALLVDRGYISYDDTIIKHWPEFSDKGGIKDEITIAELVSHRAGIPYFDNKEKVDMNELSRLQNGGRKISKEFRDYLARQHIKWDRKKNENGELPFGYHALTVGFYISELVRRCDPKHRSISQFFEEEIRIPYGIDFVFGLSSKEPQLSAPPSTQETDIYRINDLRIARLYYDRVTKISESDKAFQYAMMDKQSHTYQAFAGIKGFSPWRGRYLEIPSAVGFSNARSIAMYYGAIANNGILPTPPEHVHYNNILKSINHTRCFPVRLLAPSTIKELCNRKGGIEGYDLVQQKNRKYTKGGLYCDAEESPTARYHSGLGGSIGWADPQYGLSFAYVPNLLIVGPSEVDKRGSSITSAIYKCIKLNIHNKSAL